MNHLTNLYKHKCEQLQEQLNHLTRMLNEVTAPAPATPNTPAPPWTWADNIPDEFGDDLGNAARKAARAARLAAERAAAAAAAAAARAAREVRERLFQQFRAYSPDDGFWQFRYNNLSDADKAIYHQMFGHPPHAETVGYWLGHGTIQVRIMIGPNGIPGIYYWDTFYQTWTRLPDGVKIQGLGHNGAVGIHYEKKLLKFKEKLESKPTPGVPPEFYPQHRIPEWNPNPNIQPGPGGGRVDFGNGSGPDGSGPDGGGGGGGGGGIDPNNESGLGVQY